LRNELSTFAGRDFKVIQVRVNIESWGLDLGGAFPAHDALDYVGLGWEGAMLAGENSSRTLQGVFIRSKMHLVGGKPQFGRC
jgi:hypothetical protein